MFVAVLLWPERPRKAKAVKNNFDVKIRSANHRSRPIPAPKDADLRLLWSSESNRNADKTMTSTREEVAEHLSSRKRPKMPTEALPGASKVRDMDEVLRRALEAGASERETLLRE